MLRRRSRVAQAEVCKTFHEPRNESYLAWGFRPRSRPRLSSCQSNTKIRSAMRGHIRERVTRSGDVRYQLLVYTGLDGAGRRTYRTDTHTGPRKKAERRRAH